MAGDIASPFGGRAVLAPEDVQEIEIESLIIRSGGEERLTSEAEGLKGFLSEKSQQVRHLVRVMGDRLHDLIAPDDRWESLQHQIGRASHRTKAALESAWNQLTNRKTSA